MATVEQERQVVERLTASGGDEFETAEQAERHVWQVISDVGRCADEQADEHLTGLRDRRLLDVELTPPGGPIVGRDIPVARFRWTRPAH